MIKYLVVNIGCIECVVSSDVVGLFNTEDGTKLNVEIKITGSKRAVE